MTTGIGYTEPTAADLRDALEAVLVPELKALLDARMSGHCMRVTDVDADLAVNLVRRLRSASRPGAEVWLLSSDDTAPDGDDGQTLTSTKLVELRNRADAAGPLLVFIPPGMRASAEDSFGVATFEEVPVSNALRRLAGELLDDVPVRLRSAVDDLLAAIRANEGSQPDNSALAWYLLTLRHNGYDLHKAGAAIHRLGLVPDFELFTKPAEVLERTKRNREAVASLTASTLSHRQRVLTLGLTDIQFTARLAAFAALHGLDNPLDWTRRIALDREYWGLSFGNWPLTERHRSSVAIDVADLDLPRSGDNPLDVQKYQALAAIAGLPYLLSGEKGTPEISVGFTVHPDPRTVDGLTRFRVEIISEIGGPVGRVSHAKVGKTPKKQYKAKLAKLGKIDWEEGWHYVKVTPLDESDQPLDVDPTGHGIPGGESERFYVVPDAQIEDPPERNAGRFDGVAQALRDLQLVALCNGDDPDRVEITDVRWKPTTSRTRHRVLGVGVGGVGHIEVRLAPDLVRLQQALLAAPERLGILQLSVSPVGVALTGRDADDDLGERLTGRAIEAYKAFLEARRQYFALIRGAAEEEDGGLISEACEFDAVRDELAVYVQTFAELLSALTQQSERADDHQRAPLLVLLARILQTDTVAVSLTDGLGRHHQVLLVAPTHPLRALWLAGWSALGQDWTARLIGRDKRDAVKARLSLSALSPLGFPFAIPRQDGRLLTAVGNLTPYWGLFLPEETADPQGVFGHLTAALGVSTATDAVSAVGLSGAVLADRVERYVRLHPYVQTLVINVVNAGRAEAIADLLVELQRRSATRALHFDVRLCVSDPEAPEVGEALTALLDAREQTGVAEAEAFLHSEGGPHDSKLVFSIRSIEDFINAPSTFDAHLTVLIDVFGGERITSAAHDDMLHAPVHGLVQSTVTRYVESDQEVAWFKQPRYGTALALDEAEDLTLLLGALPRSAASAISCVATAGGAPRNVPCTVLVLDVRDRELLYHAHQVSDWVVTIDRTLGVEYFDRSAGDEPEYIIDHTPQTGGGLGHQLMVSSGSVDELRTLLGPVAKQHGLIVDSWHLRTFFEQLRLLSGSLAFKLASTAPTQRTEVLGLALARMYLEYQGVLANQIVVPLDAHPELYHEVRTRVRELGEDLSYRRSDLALFHVDPRARRITCRLVEVKCYTALHDIGAYVKLKAEVAEQLGRSRQVLTESFDPNLETPDRVDRCVKNLELASLLGLYLDSAHRHGTMSQAAHRGARRLLDDLDSGYALEFTSSGLIFDLARPGTDRELDHTVEFHRIGLDLITELIDAIPTVRKPIATDNGMPQRGSEDGTGSVDQHRQPLSQLELTLPRIPDAAFRAPATQDFEPDSEMPTGTGPADELPPVGSSDVQSASRSSSPMIREAQTVKPTSAVDDNPSGNVVADNSTAEIDHDDKPVQVDMTPDSTGPAHSERLPRATSEMPKLIPDVFLGVNGPTPQYGVLGDIGGRTVALDLNETHTISLFGVQGGGKSYTLGSIVEAACMSAPSVNELPHPLATVVFHYSQTQDYAPEFTSMVQPNDSESQLMALAERYGAEPQGLQDVLLLVPADQVQQRRAEYPDIAVAPLKFSSSELQAAHWRFLMGAVGNQSTYIRQLTQIMRANRDNLTLDAIRRGVDGSGLPDHLKNLAQQRLNLAAEYIDDSTRLAELIRPGRLVIVDLRDEFIEKDEALGLFVVLMQLFAEATDTNQPFNKLVVFDEAHKYVDSPDLVSGLVETVREMRHKGMSILVASQDPPSVPISLIELSDHIVLHKFTSPAWLKHLQKANSALSALSPERMSQLQPGEGYVWASKATDTTMTHGAVKMHFRPRITRHGGATKTATGRR